MELFEMVDIDARRHSIEAVQIVIRSDGTVLWVNANEQCVLRICNAKSIVVKDERVQKNG